jgi:putative ABC transport system permease protein
VHVSLDAIDEIHEGFNARSARRGESQRTITAFLVGLKSRMLAFRLQRQVNEYAAEPLQAILPGVALAQLWRMLGSVENVLRVISGLVLLSAFLGMSTMFLASLRERRGEIAVLRTIGASPMFLFLMLELEALLLAVLGFAGGVLLVGSASRAAQGWLRENYGLLITAYMPDATTALLLALILGLAALCALAPAVGAYRSALGKSLIRR